jgi:hypothetical protein
MSSFKQQSIAVNRVLLENWDPIGVNASDGPQDEYMNYVPHLVGLVHRDEPDATLAEFLADVEIREMGLPVSPEAKRLTVAARIKAAILDTESARLSGRGDR